MTVLLVGVDGSARAADAVAFAAWLARRSAARLLLAGVYSLDHASDDFAGGVNFARVALEGAEATLERARLSAGDDLEVQTRALPGASPAAALRRLASAEHAALVILGSTHVSRIGRIHPGSTAERLLHDGPCPVAIVPRGYATRRPETIVRIGVAHDRSESARIAWEAALALAAPAHADVFVMMAAEFAWNGTPAHAAGPEWAMTRDAVLATVRAELDATVAQAPEDVEARGVVLQGDVAGELVDRTRRLDVLFMGSRGLTPWRSVLAGGVSGRVMREAHCPVIVTPTRVPDRSLDAGAPRGVEPGP